MSSCITWHLRGSIRTPQGLDMGTLSELTWVTSTGGGDWIGFEKNHNLVDCHVQITALSLTGCVTLGKSLCPSVPQFLHLQMRYDNSTYFIGLLWWLNGSIYVKHSAWHIIHILAIIPEFWGHQMHLNSLNMKSSRPGKTNISVSIPRRTQDPLVIQRHSRQAALTHSSPSGMELGPGFLPDPKYDLWTIFSLPEWLGLTKTAPTRRLRRQVLVGKKQIVWWAFGAFALLTCNYFFCYLYSWVRASRRVRQFQGDQWEGRELGRERRRERERESGRMFSLGVINWFSSFGTEISIYWTSCMHFPVPL